MIQFEFPSLNRKDEAIQFYQEFMDAKSEIHGSGGMDVHQYEAWVDKTHRYHNELEAQANRVPASTYFVIDPARDKIIGMVNIRHRLNDYLYESGSGHVGYSVRPSERRKGYATEILKQALELLYKEYSINQVMVGCDINNIGSKKVIEINGGVLDRVIESEDGDTTLAFWIYR